MKQRSLFFLISFTALVGFRSSAGAADGPLPPVSQRFAEPTASAETPDFQRHVVPLLGKLGCNGRACHGSFQGRGGFRLSLFGYDFKADHDELYGRLDPETPAESLILQKPAMQVPHEGGQRLKADSWEYNLLRQWVQADAPGVGEDPGRLERLAVEPAELIFSADGEVHELKVVAHWQDGSVEDVTTLCRFQSNDDQVAEISEEGVVTSGIPGDSHVVVFYDNAVVPIPVIRPVSDRTGDRYPQTPTPTRVDELVVQKLRKLGMVQSDLCSDEEFLRRVTLDVTGLLPTPSEIRAFTSDESSDKRARKIDELLERPGYIATWTTKLCDFTGNSDDQLNNVTPIRSFASKQWYDWIYRRVEDNVPYDNLVEGIVLATSRDPGESYDEFCENYSRTFHREDPLDFAERSSLPHYWARRNFQSTEDRAIGFAYTFLGTRIQCAQCHKHPFDQWTQEDFKGFEQFFTGTSGRVQNPRTEDRKKYQEMVAALSGVDGLKGNQLRNQFGKLLQKGEIVPFGEVYAVAPAKPAAGKSARNNRNRSRTARSAKPLGEETVDLTEYEDIRVPLMEWLRSPENPLFARAFVNRVWASYFNRGIVHPSDDMNLANPPSNAALLDYLSEQFIAHDFDMKWLHREILNSRAYQLSWQPNPTNRLDERNFARAVPRRLPAETVWDMISQAVGSDAAAEALTSGNDGRAMAIAGAASGVRNRNIGGEAAYALTIFGRSIRESNCDCDRSDEPSLLQTVFVRNDGQMLDLIDRKGGWLAETCTSSGLGFRGKLSGNELAALRKAEARYAGQIREADKQMRALKDKAGKEKQFEAAKRRVAKLRDNLKKFRESRGLTDPAETTAAELNIPVAEIVEDAYLRTLSRLPTEVEAEASAEHIRTASDPVAGIRDVMWALVNTKEFIVNH